MKILLSADCFYPAQLGGPSNTIYWQAKALSQAGHDVTVIATSYALPPAVPLNQWVAIDCGWVMYTKNPHFYLPLNHIWQAFDAIQKADIVHVNSLFYPASLVWVLMSQWFGKPVVWSPHGELNPVALGFQSGIKKLVIQVIKRLLTPTVHFHATSSAEAGHIGQQFGEETAVTMIRSRMELPIRLEPELSGKSPRPYLLFMGRLHAIKAIDNLIRALSTSSVFREGEFILLLAGPDVDKAYTKQLTDLVQTLGLSAKVFFVGPVQGEAKEQLYANARLTVLPSHAENFGNVVIESLAQGTPVVASTNTPWQVLETEGAGSWVANNPESLRKAIETYLTMPAEDYTLYRNNAYQLARQFDSREGIPEWEQLYEAVRLGSNKKVEALMEAK